MIVKRQQPAVSTVVLALLSAGILIGTRATSITDDPLQTASFGGGLEPSDTLLNALLTLKASLNNTDFCYLRLRSLWRYASEQKSQIDDLQAKTFELLNQLAALQIESPIVTECPVPFDQIRNGCFYWPRKEKLKRWDDARRFCAKLGADLAYPRNERFLERYVSRFSPGWGYYFIGGQAKPETGFEFRWIDGRRVKSSKRNWSELYNPGQRSNCLAMEAHSNHQLKAKDCNEFKRWMICEVKVKDESMS